MGAIIEDILKDICRWLLKGQLKGIWITLEEAIRGSSRHNFKELNAYSNL